MSDQTPQGWGASQPPSPGPGRRPGVVGWIGIALAALIVLGVIGSLAGGSGSGNGPNYVDGPIRVRPPDPFRLDSDGDGVGCES